jgi:glycosyltransferase involved in cell wall biosynthesis
LPECGAVFALSGAGLEAGRKIQKRGGIYVCDRGSTHSRYQNELMQEEHKRWKMPPPSWSDFLIENEENEYATADAITVPSDFAKESFVSQGIDPKKVFVTPYGVNLQEFYPTEFKKGRDTFRILFVGQISLRKGIPDLLEAFRKFRHPKKELILVGGMQPEMRQFFLSRKLEGIRFVGVLPRNRVRKYMVESDVMVLPSIEEGQALVLAQALACGVPIIATRNTGAENLFVHGREGLIVPFRNPCALHAALERMAGDQSLLESMGNAAKKCSKKLDGWAGYAKRVLGVLDICERNKFNDIKSESE